MRKVFLRKIVSVGLASALLITMLPVNCLPVRAEEAQVEEIQAEEILEEETVTVENEDFISSPVDATEIEINSASASAPANLAYSNTDETNIVFSWTAPSDGSAVKYFLYYAKTEDGVYTKYTTETTETTLSVPRSTFIDKVTGNGGFYYFKIAAVNAAGIEILSDAIKADTNYDVPGTKIRYESMVFATTDADGNLQELDRLVIHVGQTLKVKIALKKADGSLVALNNASGLYSNPTSEVTWTNYINDDTSVYAPSAEMESATGTYVDCQLSPEYFSGNAQYYKGMAETSNQALTNDATTEAANSYLKVQAIGSVYGTFTQVLPVTVLAADEDAVSDQITVNVLDSSDELIETLRNDIRTRNYTDSFITDVKNPDWSRVFDFDAERNDMLPTEGDYIKYQLPTGTYTWFNQKEKAYKGNTYYYRYLALRMPTNATKENQVTTLINAELTSSDGAFYSIKNKSTGVKVKAAYDYVTGLGATLESSNTGSNHTAYSLLIDKKGSAQAYAVTFERLCRELGVTCKVLTGDDPATEAYNIVKFDEGWYFFDCANRIYKKTKEDFGYDLSNLNAEIRESSTFQTNYLSNLAEKSEGSVVIESDSGVELYRVATVSAAYSYINQLISEETAGNNETFTISIDASVDVSNFNAGSLAERVGFDLSGATINYQGTNLTVNALFLRNGRIKFSNENATMTVTGTSSQATELSDLILADLSSLETIGKIRLASTLKIDSLKTGKFTGGADIECPLNIEKLIVCNCSDNQKTLYNNPIKIEADVTTKYFYGYVAKESGTKNYESFNVAVDGLTVTAGSKISTGLNILLNGKASFAGRTYICDTASAMDFSAGFNDTLTYNESNSMTTGACFLINYSSECSKTQPRLIFSGILDETATAGNGVTWRDSVTNKYVSAPLCIYSVKETGGTIEQVGFKAGETVAKFESLTVIKNGDSATTTLTCQPKDSSNNIAKYVYTRMNNGSDFTDCLTLESTGKLWYAQDNVLVQYYYKAGKISLEQPVEVKYESLTDFAKDYSKHKTYTYEKKKYSVATVKIFIASDEGLSASFNLGSVSLEISKAKDLTNSSTAFEGTMDEVMLDMNGQKITCKTLKVGEGLSLKSTAAKSATLAASGGIQLYYGSYSRVNFTGLVTVQNDYKTASFTASNCNFQKGLTIEENGLAVLDGTCTIAKLYIPKNAYLYELAGANVTISAFNSSLPGVLNTGFVEISSSPVLGGEYEIAEIATETKLFNCKVTKIPVDNFTVTSTDFPVVYKKTKEIWVGKENFTLYKLEEKGAAKPATALGHYNLWTDAVAKMNEKANYLVELNENVTVGAMKLPTKATSIKLVKSDSAYDAKLSFIYTGTLSLAQDLTVENVVLGGTYTDAKIDPVAKPGAVKINNRVLELKDSSVFCSTINSGTKGKLSLNNSTLKANSTINIVGGTELSSSNIYGYGKTILNNIYSDDAGNALHITGVKNKKTGVYNGKQNVIKGFVSDTNVASDLRTSGNEINRKCALSIELLDESKNAVSETDGLVVLTANRATAGWFKTNEDVTTKSYIKNGKLLTIASSQPTAVALYSSFDNSTFGIEATFKTLKEAMAAIDATADKTRYYKITLNDDTAESVSSQKLAISFPSKLAGLTIAGTEGHTNLYFKGNIAIKSNVMLNNVTLNPKANFSITTGAYMLEMTGVTIAGDKHITSITGSKLTGDGGLTLNGGLNLTVYGKVNKLAKLVLNGGSKLNATGTIKVGQTIAN